MHLSVVRSVVIPESLSGALVAPLLNVPYHWKFNFEIVIIEIIISGE